MPRTGHCVCGDISYEADADPIVVVNCHCDDCQRQSGAAFSTNVVFPKASLSVSGTPTVFRTTGTDSGEVRERSFCGTCGSVLFTSLVEQPGIAVVKAGTLDDRTGYSPAVEVWRDSAQEWVAAVATERQTFPRDLPAG
jgi:hypothetical protein